MTTTIDTITSIDPAEMNCGIVKYSVSQDSFLRMAWVNFNYDRNGKTRISSQELVVRFMTYATETDPDIFDSDLIVVERQLLKPRGGFLSGVRNAAMEAAVVGRWFPHSESVSPTRTHKRFEALYKRYRRKTYKKKYDQNKHDATEVGKRLLKTKERLMLSAIVQHIPKTNDIYDAILQALAIAEKRSGDTEIVRRRRLGVAVRRKKYVRQKTKNTR